MLLRIGRSGRSTQDQFSRFQELNMPVLEIAFFYRGTLCAAAGVLLHYQESETSCRIAFPNLQKLLIPIPLPGQEPISKTLCERK